MLPEGYVAAEIVVGVLSMVGNALVLVAIQRTRSLHTVTNCFVASLALADMLVGIVLVPYTVMAYLGLPHNFYGCVFLNCVIILFTQVSIFSLLAVACERFVAIKDPFLYQRIMNIPRALGILSVTWVVGVLVGLVPMMGWNLKGTLNSTDTATCTFTDVIDMKYMVYFNFFGFVMVPLCLMFAIYSYIYVIVRQQMRKISALEVTSQNRKKKRQFLKEIKAAKSLAFVIGLFAACWMPIHVMNIVTLTLGITHFDSLLAAIVLSHANSMFNPFLYAYGNSQFKRAFARLFCCRPSDFLTDSDSNAGRSNYHDSRVPEGTLQTTDDIPQRGSHDGSNGHALPTVSATVPLGNERNVLVVGKKKSLPPLNLEESSKTSGGVSRNGTLNPTFATDVGSEKGSPASRDHDGRSSSSRKTTAQERVRSHGLEASNPAFTLEPETQAVAGVQAEGPSDMDLTDSREPSEESRRHSNRPRQVAFQEDVRDEPERDTVRRTDAESSVQSRDSCDEVEMFQPIAVEGNTLIFRL